MLLKYNEDKSYFPNKTHLLKYVLLKQDAGWDIRNFLSYLVKLPIGFRLHHFCEHDLKE